MAKKCKKLFDHLSLEFHDVFYNVSIGAYGSGLQTEQALPLFLGIVPENLTASVLSYTIKDIIEIHGTHTTSGILGIKFMLEVLALYGRMDVAISMLIQTTFPSYGFMIKGGNGGYEPASTLWELWNSDTGSDTMDSRNHIMFGSVGAFFYKYVLGVIPESPGYRCILFHGYLSLGEKKNACFNLNAVTLLSELLLFFCCFREAHVFV